MVRNYPVRIREGWYLARLGWLEWLETILKLGAIAIGITSLVLIFPIDRLALPAGLSLVQFSILFIMSLGLFGATFERLDQKEIGAMVFILLNNMGHWSLLLAIASGFSISSLIIVFSALMLSGDLTKLTFFATSDFTIRNTTKTMVLAVISLFASGYLVILMLELFT